MWKYRSPVIFLVALGFAIKTAFAPSIVPLIAMIAFLACHYIDRFFGTERLESKAVAKIASLEEELKNARVEINRCLLVMGIRGGK